MPIFRYHITSFFSRFSHYAFVELVVENLVAQNFLGKYDCASVQNICALKGFASWLCLFCFFSFFLHFTLQKKSPTELESKTMVYLNIQKVACCSFVQEKKRVDSRSSTRLEKKSTIRSCRRWTLNTFFEKMVFHLSSKIKSKKTSIFEKKMVFWKKMVFTKRWNAQESHALERNNTSRRHTYSFWLQGSYTWTT